MEESVSCNIKIIDENKKDAGQNEKIFIFAPALIKPLVELTQMINTFARVMGWLRALLR